MKKSPLTPAQRKSIQRKRDKAILNACGIQSLESIMKQIRKMDDNGKQQLYTILFGRVAETTKAQDKARPQAKRTRQAKVNQALRRG